MIPCLILENCFFLLQLCKSKGPYKTIYSGFCISLLFWSKILQKYISGAPNSLAAGDVRKRKIRLARNYYVVMTMVMVVMVIMVRRKITPKTGA